MIRGKKRTGARGRHEQRRCPELSGSAGRPHADRSATVDGQATGGGRLGRPERSPQARAQIAVPTYAVKIIPGYRGDLRVCDLTRTQISDLTIKEAWTGPARLQLFAHVMAPLADLPVLEVVSASHIVADLTLAPMQPVHDYLATG